MLIGERPGLSAPRQSRGLSDLRAASRPHRRERNCVSNIHAAGLGYDEAAFKIAWLVREGLAREVTGVALKDESGGRRPQHRREFEPRDKSADSAPIIGVNWSDWRWRSRLRDATQTCYTPVAAIYCMFSRASANHTRRFQASFAPRNLS